MLSVFEAGNPLTIVAISACMAGAVCGDHCSPISDTTIMSSAGARCDHINHVSTQLPYAITVAAISFVGYLITGVLTSIKGLPESVVYVSIPVLAVITVGTLFIIKAITKKSK